MASSRDTSVGPDWRDLEEAIRTFETQDNVKVHIAMETTITGKTPDLRLTLSATRSGTVPAEPVNLGFVSVTCLGTSRKSLEAAILALLYQLDFKLALDEFDGTIKKR